MNSSRPATGLQNLDTMRRYGDCITAISCHTTAAAPLLLRLIAMTDARRHVRRRACAEVNAFTLRSDFRQRTAGIAYDDATVQGCKDRAACIRHTRRHTGCGGTADCVAWPGTANGRIDNGPRLVAQPCSRDFPAGCATIPEFRFLQHRADTPYAQPPPLHFQLP